MLSAACDRLQLQPSSPHLSQVKWFPYLHRLFKIAWTWHEVTTLNVIRHDLVLLPYKSSFLDCDRPLFVVPLIVHLKLTAVALLSLYSEVLWKCPYFLGSPALFCSRYMHAELGQTVKCELNYSFFFADISS